MSGDGNGSIPEEIFPDDDGQEPPADDHDYEPHFSRVRESMEELRERVDAVIERCRELAHPSPRRRAILERALQIREEMDRLSDESGVRLGVGHMRVERRVQLVEIRLRELEETGGGGDSAPGT